MLKTLFIDNAILVIQFAVSGLIPLLLIPHIIKTVGLSSYGDIAIGLSWANYAAVIVQYAFSLTGPKLLAQADSEESKKSVFWNVFTAKSMLYALVFSVSIIVFLATNPAQYSLAIFLVYSLLPLGAVFHAGWYLQTMGRFMVVSVVSSCAAAVTLLTGFLLVLSVADIPIAIFALTIGSVLSGLGTFFVSRRMLSNVSCVFNWRESLSYLQDGWTIFFSQFVASIYTMSGPIVIGQLLDSRAAGAYSAVERIVTAVSCVCLLTHTAAYPRLAGLYRTDRRAYRRLMTAVLCIYLAAAVFFCGLVAFAGDHFTRFIFGGDAQGYGTLLWWGMSLIPLGIFGPMVTGYLVVSGHQDRVYPLTMKILVVAMVLGVPGVIYYGSWAWFCSLAIAQSLVLWTGFLVLRK